MRYGLLKVKQSASWKEDTMHDKLLPSKIHFEKLFGFCPLRRGSRYVLDEVISGPEFGGSHSFLILLSAFFQVRF